MSGWSSVTAAAPRKPAAKPKTHKSKRGGKEALWDLTCKQLTEKLKLLRADIPKRALKATLVDLVYESGYEATVRDEGEPVAMEHVDDAIPTHVLKKVLEQAGQNTSRLRTAKDLWREINHLDVDMEEVFDSLDVIKHTADVNLQAKSDFIRRHWKYIAVIINASNSNEKERIMRRLRGKGAETTAERTIQEVNRRLLMDNQLYEQYAEILRMDLT